MENVYEWNNHDVSDEDILDALYTWKETVEGSIEIVKQGHDDNYMVANIRKMAKPKCKNTNVYLCIAALCLFLTVFYQLYLFGSFY